MVRRTLETSIGRDLRCISSPCSRHGVRTTFDEEGESRTGISCCRRQEHSQDGNESAVPSLVGRPCRSDRVLLPTWEEEGRPRIPRTRESHRRGERTRISSDCCMAESCWDAHPSCPRTSEDGHFPRVQVLRHLGGHGKHPYDDGRISIH